MFGKNKQHTKSVNTSDDNVSINIGEKEDYMIPASRIAQLSQGHFVGIVADDVKYPIPQKAFHAKMDLDIKAIDAEEKAYKPIPQIYNFNNKKTYEEIGSLISSSAYNKAVEKGDFKSAQQIIENCKLEDKKNKKEIEQIELTAMQRVMEQNTRKIEKELDNLIKREIEKIEQDPRFADIAEMRNKLLNG